MLSVSVCISEFQFPIHKIGLMTVFHRIILKTQHSDRWYEGLRKSLLHPGVLVSTAVTAHGIPTRTLHCSGPTGPCVACLAPAVGTAQPGPLPPRRVCISGLWSEPWALVLHPRRSRLPSLLRGQALSCPQASLCSRCVGEPVNSLLCLLPRVS